MPLGEWHLWNGTALFARPLDALQGTRLATGEIRSPVVSPDGRWVGFTEATSMLKRVALTGGAVVAIAATEGGNWRGAVWLPDDTVICYRSAGERTATGFGWPW